MGDNKAIREPRQKRSIEKKQLVIDTARELFCRNGYHNTTTNEIAKEAGLSIGTLYSYFADKETILLELLEQYNEHFYRVFDFIDTEENVRLYYSDLHKWIRLLVDNLIRLHDPQIAFYRELEVLYYSIPEVTAMMDAQTERVRLATLNLMEKYKEKIKCDDLEAASVVAVDFINALVDRIVFKENVVDKERLIISGVEAIYKTFTRE